MQAVVDSIAEQLIPYLASLSGEISVVAESYSC